MSIHLKLYIYTWIVCIATASLMTTTQSGDLMFQFLGSSAGSTTLEFGIGTPSTTSNISERDMVFIIDTAANTAFPGNIVNMGYYFAGSDLDFYNLSKGKLISRSSDVLT